MCKITHEGVTYLEGYVNNYLYENKIKHDSIQNVNMINHCEKKNCLHKRHVRLDHRNVNGIKELVDKI